MAGGGLGEDLAALRRDAQGMLELGRERAVLGHRRPTVGQHLHLVSAGIDHRLPPVAGPTARFSSTTVGSLMAWSLLQPFVVRFKDRVVADQSHVRGHETTMANYNICA